MVEIRNFTRKKVNKNFLKQIVQRILQEEGFGEDMEVSIVLVGSDRMKKLNNFYRGINRPTDVLSFEEQKHAAFVSNRCLGEIVVCLNEVKKNAKKYGFSWQRELVFILIHGVLHLLGYNHEGKEAEAKIMEQKQQHYFRSRNL